MVECNSAGILHIYPTPVGVPSVRVGWERVYGATAVMGRLRRTGGGVCLGGGSVGKWGADLLQADLLQGDLQATHAENIELDHRHLHDLQGLYSMYCSHSSGSEG